MQLLADEKQIEITLERLAAECQAVMARGGPWAIVGMRSRGDLIAARLAEKLRPDATGTLDITLYRDDLSEVGSQPIVRTTDIPFDVDQYHILLVDDVLMTGRSVRAALQVLIDFGRPRCVKLLVLADRGGRELPIAPDFVGMRVMLEADQEIEVRLKPTDPEDAIVIYQTNSKKR